MCKIADVVVWILLMLCGVCDWKKKSIPYLLLLVFSAAVLILTFVKGEVAIELRLFGLAIGILLLLVSKLTGEAIGYGDSWIMLLLGVYLGGLQMAEMLFAASVLAGFASVFCLWRHHFKRSETLPFVPFLCISYLGVMIL